MATVSSLETLIEALRCLPGIGPKSAQRMAYYLMQRDRPGARNLADALQRALVALRHCQRCNTLTESDICERCASPRRDPLLWSGTMPLVVRAETGPDWGWPLFLRLGCWVSRVVKASGREAPECGTVGPARQQ